MSHLARLEHVASPLAMCKYRRDVSLLMWWGALVRSIVDNKPTLVFFVADAWQLDNMVTLQFQVYNPALPVDIDAIPVTVRVEPEASAEQVNQLILDQATIREVDMDYDEVTVLDVVGAAAGDAHPLLVYPAEFTHNNISQSTSVPRATSTVTLRFSTSLELSVNQTIELSFDDVVCEESLCQNVWTQSAGKYPLEGPHKEFFKADSYSSPGTACWSQGRTDAGIDGIKLMLYVAQETTAGQIYEITIALQNPLPAQTSLPAYLRVLDVMGQTMRCSRQTYISEDDLEEISLDSWAHCR